jgi:hypothetical protein
MSTADDMRAVVAAIESTPAAVRGRAAAALIMATGRGDIVAAERAAKEACVEAAFSVLDEHPEIRRFLQPPADASLAVYILRCAGAIAMGDPAGGKWAVTLDLRDRSGEN